VAEVTSRLTAAEAKAASLQQADSEARRRLADLSASLELKEQILKRLTEENAVKDSQIVTLHGTVRNVQAESASLTDELSREKLHGRQHLQQIEALQAALSHAIEKARTDAARAATALEEQTEHTEELRVRLKSSSETIAELEEEITTLNVGLEAARSQWNQVSAELREVRFENSKLQDQRHADAEELHLLHEQHRELESTLEKSQQGGRRLAAVIDLQQAKMSGLENYRGRLEKKIQAIGQSLFLTGQQLRKGDRARPSVLDSISQNIRSIANPPAAWIIAKALGFLRFAPEGAPRTIHERESIAHELEAGLQDISDALSSAKKTPDAAAAELPRLFELERRTWDLLRSFGLSGLRTQKSSIWNLVHWVRQTRSDFSVTEEISSLFDPAWYLGRNPDVAAFYSDPLEHYLLFGAREGRDPNPAFDTKWYLAKNPQCDPDTVNPLAHYCEMGIREGADPNPLFDSAWYLALNPDVSGTGLNPLAHYLRYGVKEGRSPHPLFDSRWYCSTNPEVAAINPLEHYFTVGARLGLTTHPLFDPSWYLERYPEIAAAGVDPLLHYLEYGAKEGRSPHPLFDPAWYLQQTENSAEAAANPLRHYVMFGARQRLSPSPYFDPHHYAGLYPEARDCGDLLQHYLTVGWRRGYRPSITFDPQLYLRKHAEVRASGTEPLTAFARSQIIAG
jgi:hypothetical protein